MSYHKTIHKLKTWPEYYRAIVHDEKNFEIRKADRDFKKSHILELHEWDPVTKKYTGCQIQMRIKYILKGGQFGLKDGYVAMALKFMGEGQSICQMKQQHNRK